MWNIEPMLNGLVERLVITEVKISKTDDRKRTLSKCKKLAIECGNRRGVGYIKWSHIF